jgi:hypothetical protein
MMSLINLIALNPCCNAQIAADPIWHKLAESAVTGVFALAGISFAAWLAYRYALRQKRMEILIRIEQVKYERTLEALENCWKLLIYTTDTENEKCIITWEQQKGNPKKYYLNTLHAKEFIKSLADFHYNSGLGIYLSKEIKELIFQYRSIIYGFLLKERDNENGKVEVKNNEMAASLIKIHQELLKQLQHETKVIDKTELKNSNKI